jgi:hypothetical protein
MLPQSNAVLTKVERAGGTLAGGWSEDWDRPATDPEADPGGGGEDVLVGGADAYYRERRERVPAAEGSDRNIIVRRSLTVDGDLPIDVREEDVVTFTFNGDEKTGTVLAVEESDYAPVRSTRRITLVDV